MWCEPQVDHQTSATSYRGMIVTVNNIIIVSIIKFCEFLLQSVVEWNIDLISIVLLLLGQEVGKDVCGFKNHIKCKIVFKGSDLGSWLRGCVLIWSRVAFFFFSYSRNFTPKFSYSYWYQ